ncbi:MAG: GNAT family N-acetyltransferase [Gemmatirosa sp.]
MPDVVLLPIDDAMMRDVADPARIARAHDVTLGAYGELVRGVIVQMQAFVARIGAPPAWGGFLAVDAGTRTVVGTCGYKGAPDADGCVEIAYFTFPTFEGRGWATAMAGALVDRAARQGARLARAHTLPEPSASTRVLQRSGFAHEGEVDDPEDGRVWRWGRPLASPATA